jgi:hypothetical protein
MYVQFVLCKLRHPAPFLSPSVPGIMSVFAGLFLTDGAELHQKSSQIMYHDNCLPIYLYYSFMVHLLDSGHWPDSSRDRFLNDLWSFLLTFLATHGLQPVHTYISPNALGVSHRMSEIFFLIETKYHKLPCDRPFLGYYHATSPPEISRNLSGITAQPLYGFYANWLLAGYAGYVGLGSAMPYE